MRIDSRGGTTLLLTLPVLALVGLVHCGDDDAASASATDAGTTSTSTADASSSSSSPSSDEDDASTSSTDAGSSSDAGATYTGDGGLSSGTAEACAALATQQARVACAASAFLATLSTAEQATASMALTDYVDRSKWNNLPVSARTRAGIQLKSLSATSQAAALDLMTIALATLGQTTMTGILRADDYLGTMANGYGSGLYSVAIFGTPTATGDFEVMFGGHHMAYNLNFVGGSFYPVPQHLGCEPRASFTYDGASYAPMAPKGDAMFAVYSALDATQKTNAYLSGQTFSDVIVAPDLDYGKGAGRTSKTAYPTGSNRKGVLVSSMTSAQQALVTAAIEQWVRQYPAEVVDSLMSAYTGGYGDTYFAWGGSSAGASADTSGSYLRIDGPRVWIELAVQGGIVIRNTTHYHTIFHDKTYDYGGQF